MSYQVLQQRATDYRNAGFKCIVGRHYGYCIKCGRQHINGPFLVTDFSFFNVVCDSCRTKHYNKWYRRFKRWIEEKRYMHQRRKMKSYQGLGALFG